MNHFVHCVSLFFKIATFQSAPQDVPATRAALYAGVVLAIVVSLLRYLTVGSDGYPIARVLLEVAMPGLLLFALMLFFKLPHRFGQTFSALCGSGAFIYLFALPLLPALYGPVDAPGYGMSMYLVIAIDIWSIFVVANILRHAINVGFASGISFAIALGLISLLLVESFAPTSTVEPAIKAQVSANPD